MNTYIMAAMHTSDVNDKIIETFNYAYNRGIKLSFEETCELAGVNTSMVLSLDKAYSYITEALKS